jgi:hypothetical protein
MVRDYRAVRITEFFELLGLTENSVDRCSAYWALALSHAAT